LRFDASAGPFTSAELAVRMVESPGRARFAASVHHPPPQQLGGVYQIGEQQRDRRHVPPYQMGAAEG